MKFFIGFIVHLVLFGIFILLFLTGIESEQLVIFALATLVIDACIAPGLFIFLP